MELFSFWVVSPADGQQGKPEPIKITFFENGDLNVISLAEDPEFRGAYKLPCGSYSYSGDTLKVSEENLGKICTLARYEDEAQYYSGLLASDLITDREWGLFYANPIAWKSLPVVAVTFGEDSGERSGGEGRGI
ncbi:MAG: hypothetical protein CVU89_12230 [Firmicutes bacterium HGW-Firmicutes-14]|nr:MAG: hypothetical protein CVU89_12230 [Firmicutes bacterium HGW-Firmicutes-14]